MCPRLGRKTKLMEKINSQQKLAVTGGRPLWLNALGTDVTIVGERTTIIARKCLLGSG